MKKITCLILLFVYSFAQNLEADDFSYAMKLYNENYYDVAIRSFESFLNNYPASSQRADGMYYLAMSFKERNDLDNALKTFRRVAIDFSNFSKAPDAFFQAGIILEMKKDWLEAAKSFETVKILYSQSSKTPEALVKAVDMYDKAGDQAKAEYLSRTIIDQYSESQFYIPAKIKLADLLRSVKKYDEALRELSSIPDNSSFRFDIIYQKALISIDENEYESALDLLKSIENEKISLQKKSDWNYQSGEINFRYQDFKAARSNYSQVSEDNFKALARERIADSYFLEGNLNQAISFYENNEQPIAQFKLALAYQKNKLNQNAYTILNSIVQSTDKLSSDLNEYLFLHYAQVLEQLNKQVELTTFITEIESSVRILDIRSNLLLMLGDSYEKRIEIENALRIYNRFLLSEPNYNRNDIFLWRKAGILEKQGLLNEAKDIYRSISTNYPVSEFYQPAIDKIAILSDTEKSNSTRVFQKFSLLLSDIIGKSDQSGHYYKLAEINFNDLLDYQSAALFFGKSIQTAKTDIIKHQSMLKLALSYLKLGQINNDTGKLNLAVDAFVDILKTKVSSDIQFEASKGLIQARLDLLAGSPALNEKAIAYYQSLIKGNSTHTNIADVKLSLSKYLIDKGDLQQASIELKAIENSKHKEIVFLRLAEIYQKLKRPAESADFYKELLSSFPTGKYRFLALKSLAELEDELGNRSNAIAFKRILITDYPQLKQDRYRNELVTFYIENGQLPEAEKMIRKMDVISLTNDLVLINELNLISYDKLLQLAKLNDYKDNNQDALRFYNDYLRFSKSGSNDNEVRLAMAELYIEQGRKDLALNHLKKISDTFSNYDHVRKTLAILSFEQEDYPAVISYSAPLLKSMTANDPAFVTLNRNYIIARIKQSESINFKAELAQYKKSFSSDREGQAQLIIEYGKEERKRNNYSKSIKILEDVIDDYDNTSLVDNALFYTILNYFTLNNMEKALKLVNEFFETYPNSDVTGEMYNSLGNTYSRIGKFDSAIEAYKSALLKTEKQDVKRISYSNLISVFKSAGLWESVLTTANTFIQLFPNDPSLIDIKILIGQSYAYLNRGTEGINFLKKLKLIADADREPEIQYSIADIYYKMKNFEAAVQEYIKIPLLSKKTNLPWIPTSYYYAGRSYEYLSRNKDAIRMFEQVIARPDSDSLMKKEARKRINDLKNLN